MKDSSIKVGVIADQTGPLSGSLKPEDVLKALDHAKIPQGPGGPAEMVPGQHHVRMKMNMYVAQVSKGKLQVVKSLGAIDPRECRQGVMGANRGLGAHNTH